MKSFAVIGLGRFGTQLAHQLAALGEEVLAIDSNEAPVNQIADSVTRAVVANAKDKETLIRLGVQDCDCAIVALASDLGTSVLITMNLKSLKVPKIVCKAYDETHREILEKLGADQVIIPEHLVADKLAASLASSDILDFIELSNDYGIIECKAPAAWIGKTLRELRVRSIYGVNVIALKKGSDIHISPASDDVIEADQVVVLLGDYISLRKIEAL